MRTMIIIVLCLAASLGVAYAAGVRVFVVKPIGAIPDGVTLIVSGAPGLNVIDSPDAFCQRQQGYVNLLCRATALGAVGNRATILVRLPYMSALDVLAGTPITDR